MVQTGALQTLASAWKLPTELAADLVKIALFDVVVLVDDSGSMKFEENGERIEDLKMYVLRLGMSWVPYGSRLIIRILAKVAFACSLFDHDGM